MKLKTKALTFAAATALTLSASSGVLADGTVTAELRENPAGICTAAVSGAQDLGDFVWASGSFGAATGAGVSSLELAVNQTFYTNWNCNVVVTSTGLTGPNGGALSLTITGAPTGAVAVDADGVAYPLEASITPDASQPVGVYSGTIIIDTVNAS